MRQGETPPLCFLKSTVASCASCFGELSTEKLKGFCFRSCFCCVSAFLITSLAGLEAGSKYGDGGGPLAVSPTSPSAGPKSALGTERHHAAAKALTSTKVRRAHDTCLNATAEIARGDTLSYRVVVGETSS